MATLCMLVCYNDVMKKRWNEEELKLLIEYYPIYGSIKTAELLKRTKYSIQKKAGRLLIKTYGNGYIHPNKNKPNYLIRGELNGYWKGDKVGYTGMHAWIKRYLPKPKVCESCQIKKPYDLANISQTYKRDLTDWEWLCRSCHMYKDGRIKNLVNKKGGGYH